MIEDIMGGKESGKQRVDFDIDKIASNNPFEQVVEDNCVDVDEGLKVVYLKSKTELDRISVYLNWLGKKLEKLLLKYFQIDDVCGDVESPSRKTQKLYEIKGTNVLVSFMANTLKGDMEKHFFVRIDKKGDYQGIADLVEEYKTKVEEGYFNDVSID